MSAKDKVSIYLAGDGGEDEFCYRGATIKVPEGVFFVAKALGSLLPAEHFVLHSPPRSKAAAPLKRASLEKRAGVVRIARYETITPHATIATSKFHEPSGFAKSERRLLIAHHSGTAWENATPTLEKFVASLKYDGGIDDWPGSRMPRILINLSSHLPRPHVPLRDKSPFESRLWNLLHTVCDQVGIVMSVSAIRSEHGAVSRRLSWEQGVEDVTAELHQFPRLKVLTAFKHLFIRVGMVGFIHVERKQPVAGEPPLQGQVVFAAYAKDGIHRDQQLSGTTFGRNTVFIAALVHAYQSGEFLKSNQRQTFRDVCWRALRGIRAVDDKGYSHALNEPIKDSLSRAAIEISDPTAYQKYAQSIWASRESQEFREKLDSIVCERTIPSYLMSPPLPSAIRTAERWRILDDALLESPVHRINVAMAIVKAGHERVLNRRWTASDDDSWKTLTRVEYWNPRDNAPDFVTLTDDDMPAAPQSLGQWAGTKPILGDVSAGFELAVPVITVGKVTAVEREEIEGLRGITNLLRAYASNVMDNANEPKRWPSPISIAVFGPPGTGKTFAAKQIAKTLDKLVRELEISNVAQFHDVRDLQDAFLKIKPPKRRPLENVPIMLFDEFDCACEGTELGWLKSFLGPMTKEFTPAILFFAGGVHHSFDRFDPFTDMTYENRRDLDEYRARVAHFVRQKGPDFTSRLRGYLNIPSIDDKPGRVKHFIRRALLLRSLLESRNLVGDDGARVDDAIIYALLTVDAYRHGARSMEAVIEMCPKIAGRVEIASLPSRAQLSMHVDAEEFLTRVHRGRVRGLEEWGGDPNSTS